MSGAAVEGGVLVTLTQEISPDISVPGRLQLGHIQGLRERECSPLTPEVEGRSEELPSH